jgi:hypothetical protein
MSRAASAAVAIAAAAIAGLAGCANQSAYGEAPALPPASPVYQSAPPPAAAPSAPGQAASPLPAAPPSQAVQAGPAPSQTPTASGQPPADPWPREVTLNGAPALLYQPQVESWSGNQLAFRMAMGLKTGGGSAETYGVVWGSARTHVDKGNRLVTLDQLSVSQIKFPTLPDNGSSYLPALRQTLPGALATISLSRLEASLAASGTAQPAALEVNNTPPAIIVSYGPAILVPIEGQPVWRAVPDSRFERVINTQAMLARKRDDGTVYLHVYDGWMSASSLSGPWTQAFFPPLGLDDVAQRLAKEGRVDLLDGGPNANPKPALSAGAPAIYVTQAPTELLIFKRTPNFQPITGTNLLWATNTEADVIVDVTNNLTYFLAAGRWYRAPSLNGPWSYVPANALPADFARIPKDGPAGVVLASVAGTPQAQEAVIANSIPQTATVLRAGGPTFVPSFDGAPQWAPIAGTPLQSVLNSQTPIIQVDPSSYYAVKGGVWFTAASLTGPWTVATSVPPVIYAIPVASPIHYVTYVYVYGYTPEVVYVGYTPGYMGTVVSSSGVVVYGTGYAYNPWIGSVWYPAPVTYGVAAAPVYNPAVGWTFGFAMGLTTAALWAPYWGGAYYHPYYYGYPCCGSASANVYRSWGYGTSSGTRTWYSNPGGSFGTSGSGSYSTYRGTTGGYNFNRSYNPYQGTGQSSYGRSFTTATGTTGSVSRGATYNAQTGQRTYSSQMGATAAGGSSINRNVSATAGPQGYGRDATTTTYNAQTGQTKTWSNGAPQNTHYAGADGNAYRSDGAGGWQQHSSGGWGSAQGDTSWANREQQARSAGESRESAFGSGAGGWDRSGAGSSSWGDRFGSSGGGWGDHFHGGGFGGGDGGWGNRFGSSSYADRFGGGGFGSHFGGGGFGGGRFGGFRR